MMKNSWILFIVSVLLCISCEKKQQKLAFVGMKIEPTISDDGQAISDTILHKVLPFSFINQDGKTITEKEMQGKITIVDFFFTTCPTICRDMTGNMVELQKMLQGEEGIMILSHSVNPTYDSPKILKEYADSYGANTKNWHFLTGEQKAIYKQGFDSYFINANKDELAPGGFLHSEFFVLVDKNGHLRSRRDEHGNIKAMYDGTKAEEVKMLYQDIKRLQKEQ
ncbi:MAG: SCO family protein [Flavobacteriales bacterium]|jgi:protein SCO1/2|nr:SCO family protein [Flavobacteriales bacterium]